MRRCVCVSSIIQGRAERAYSHHSFPPGLLLQTTGASVMVLSGGMIYLTNAVFHSNFDNGTDTGDTGVANSGGAVRCNLEQCLPVCTLCDAAPQEDDETQPWEQPLPIDSNRGRTDSALFGSVLIAVVVVLSLFLCLAFCVVAVGRRRRVGACGRACGRDAVVGYAELVSLAAPRNAAPEPSMAERSLPWSIVASSPAPVFVVDVRMRIGLWSPGMAIAAPLLFDPMGGLLSDLPFVSPRARARLNEAILRIFDRPDDDDDGGKGSNQTVLLHLQTKNGPVLLEMVASVLGAASDRIVVLTGREVDSGLAGLIACCCESTTTESADDDHTSSGFLTCGEDAASKISSLTLDPPPRALIEAACDAIPATLVHEEAVSDTTRYGAPDFGRRGLAEGDAALWRAHDAEMLPIERGSGGSSSFSHMCEAYRVQYAGVRSDTSSANLELLEDLWLRRRAVGEAARQRSAWRAVRTRLRAIGAFTLSGRRREIKRVLTLLWLRCTGGGCAETVGQIWEFCDAPTCT